MIKLLDQNNISVLQPTFVPLPQKKKRSAEHKLINLIRHTLKIFHKIRISKKCVKETGKSQFGFGLETNEASVTIQVLIQNRYDQNMHVLHRLLYWNKKAEVRIGSRRSSCK